MLVEFTPEALTLMLREAIARRVKPIALRLSQKAATAGRDEADIA
jgi:hypothetical protein